MASVQFISANTQLIVNGQDFVPSAPPTAPLFLNLEWKGGKGFAFASIAAIGIYPAGTIDTDASVTFSWYGALPSEYLTQDIGKLDSNSPNGVLSQAFDLPAGTIAFVINQGSGSGITGLVASVEKVPTA